MHRPKKTTGRSLKPNRHQTKRLYIYNFELTFNKLQFTKAKIKSIMLMTSNATTQTTRVNDDEAEKKEEKSVMVASNFQGGCSTLSLWRIGDKLIVRKQSIEKVQYLCESEALKHLSGHPHVVRMISYNEGVLYLEYCQNGDLFDYIHNNGRLSEKKCKTIMSQLCSALIAAKQQKIFHRDIKAENVFFDKFGNTKLGDWGLASFRESSSVIRGTLGSIAPDFFTREGLYDLEKADVWSLGVLLFTIVFGAPPYESPKVVRKEDNRQLLECCPLLQLILTKQWKKFWVYQERRNTKGLKPLIESMLSVDPKERPTFEEISSHPWLIESTEEDPPIVCETKCGLAANIM